MEESKQVSAGATETERAQGSDKDVGHIFVYGTLRTAYGRLPPSVRKLRPPQVLQGANRWVCEATISNFALYDLGYYPGVVPGTGAVTGDVFRVDCSELPELDEYEGIYDAQYEDNDGIFEYKRIAVDATTKGTEHHMMGKVRAWLYVLNVPLATDAVLVPDGDYVSHCERQLSGQ